MKRRMIALLLCGMTSSLCHAATNWKELLVDALNSSSGTATAILDDAMADRLKRALKTQAPVVAKVTTVQSLPGKNCKRLAIEISIPEQTFLTTDGKKKPFVTGFRMNLCANGMPPSLEKVD